MSVGSVVSLDCLVDDSDSTPRTITATVLTLMSPLFLLVIINGVWLLYLFRKERQHLFVRRMMLSILAVLYISYIHITRRLIRVLYCVETSDGEEETYYWTEDTSVECYSGSHGWLLGVLVVPCCVLLIAFPIWTGIYLISKRDNNELSTEFVRETLGFVFAAYREEVIFWDSIIILRKGLIALIVVFSYPLGGSLQGLICVFILFVALIMHVIVVPFKQETFAWLNQAEGFSLTASVTTFFFGLFLDDPNAGYPVKVIITIGVMCVNIFFLVFMLSNIFHTLLHLMRTVLTELPEWSDKSRLNALPWFKVVQLFLSSIMPKFKRQ